MDYFNESITESDIPINNLYTLCECVTCNQLFIRLFVKKNNPFSLKENGFFCIMYNHKPYKIMTASLEKTASMDDWQRPKRLLYNKPVGRKSFGRPKRKWVDGVEKNIAHLS